MKTLTMTDEQWESFKERIKEMRSMYADEERDEWFDADDLARDVADDLGKLMDGYAEWEERTDNDLLEARKNAYRRNGCQGIPTAHVYD